VISGMFHTYIIYSEKADRYYVGHCEDLIQRLERHNKKMVPSTKSYAPWRLVYHETYSTRQEANARELYIKKMKSRRFIENLINEGLQKK
jgi:putative endonuclease